MSNGTILSGQLDQFISLQFLIKSGHMRMVKKDNQWELHNTRTKDIALFERMGFTPAVSYTI